MNNIKSGPMVYIANYWMANSSTDVRVFSNCDRVALYLNDSLISLQNPDQNQFTTNLVHPPFTFRNITFIKGKLKAVGLINGEEVVDHIVKTPEKPERIDLEFDLSGRGFRADGSDVIFVYAKIVDGFGTVAHDYNGQVEFELNGPGSLIGENPIKAEAGIATILLESSSIPGTIDISCKLVGKTEASDGRVKIETKAI